MYISTLALLSPVLCLFCDVFADEQVDGPSIIFTQNGQPVAAELIDDINEVSLQAAPFTMTFDPELFHFDLPEGVQLTVLREELAASLLIPCDIAILGPFFGALSRYPDQVGLDRHLVRSEPADETGNVWWYAADSYNVLDPSNPQIRITGITDEVTGENLIAPEEDVFVIAYDAPRNLHRCTPPEGTPDIEPLIDGRLMSFWRLKF
ncbi:hypothetical protein QTO30_09405 [Yoonia sp. GPGPB17]|uniref:hypothetical protein n=1 Tax=Yoonia sp. GPGPB17 TaxID=3026147 RepID=UPI0030BD60AA